jgi:hypothetical protein
MNHYSVRTTIQADIDIEGIHYFIFQTCKSPLTSKRFIEGIFQEILSLTYLAESFPVSTSRSILQYGFNARRINFKKMAIIYTVHDKTVLIQRVIPGALVSEI